MRQAAEEALHNVHDSGFGGVAAGLSIGSLNKKNAVPTAAGNAPSALAEALASLVTSNRQDQQLAPGLLKALLDLSTQGKK